MADSMEIKQKELVLMVVTIESLLFFISLGWGYFAHINPFNSIKFNSYSILYAATGTIFLLGINFLAVNVLSKYIFFFKYLKEAYNEVAPIAANITFPGAFIIALFSGFAEEFFFRGIIQVQFGIIIASVIFGIFHIGNKKTFWYGLYAILIGLYLGWIYHITGNLLVSMLIHCLNNFLALFYMRYYYNKYIVNKNE